MAVCETLHQGAAPRGHRALGDPHVLPLSMQLEVRNFILFANRTDPNYIRTKNKIAQEGLPDDFFLRFFYAEK